MNRLQQLLHGRNGMDQLSFTSLFLAAAALIISSVTGFTPLVFLYLVFVVYTLFRVLSRDIHSRRRENIRFMSAINLVVAPLKLRYRMLSDIKTHRYLRCPRCKSWLRVPKGKGRIAISCTRCGDGFIRKV